MGRNNPNHAMRILLYIIGALIFAGAAAYAAMALGVPPVWVGVIVAAIIGLGIMGAASSAGHTGRSGQETVINKIE